MRRPRKSKQRRAQEKKVKLITNKYLQEQGKRNRFITLANKANRAMNRLIKENKGHTKAYQSALKRYVKWSGRANVASQEVIAFGKKLEEEGKKLDSLD